MKKAKKSIPVTSWNNDLFELNCVYTFKNYNLKNVVEPSEAIVTLTINYNTFTSTANEDDLFKYVDEVKNVAEDYKDAIKLISEAMIEEFIPERMILEINVTNSKTCDKQYRMHYDLKEDEEDLGFNNFFDDEYEDDYDEFFEEEEELDSSHLRLIKDNKEEKSQTKGKKKDKKKK